MADITFTIDNAKLQQMIDMTLWLFPNTEVDGNGDPLWTDSQWAKEAWRRHFVRQIKRHKDFVGKEAINNPEDDAAIT